MIRPDGSEVFPKLPDGTDGAWRWSRERVERDAHLIEWIGGRAGLDALVSNVMPDERFRPPETIWRTRKSDHSRRASYEIKALFGGLAFSTPKPERLMQRIIHIGSEAWRHRSRLLRRVGHDGSRCPQDGSAMGRHRARAATRFEQYALPRLTKVVEGRDPGGVTELVGWEGGGGFRVLEVAPSMFEADGGLVFLADWMTNGKLAEATAAQLGFEYEADAAVRRPQGTDSPGRRRRSRERGAWCACSSARSPTTSGSWSAAPGIDTDARPMLRELRPGSTLRKIPAALLDEYRSSRQLRLDLATPANVGRS